MQPNPTLCAAQLGNELFVAVTWPVPRTYDTCVERTGRPTITSVRCAGDLVLRTLGSGSLNRDVVLVSIFKV